MTGVAGELKYGTERDWLAAFARVSRNSLPEEGEGVAFEPRFIYLFIYTC